MTSVRGTFYEFFAGGGMVRAGLGERWRCLFANDFDRKKAVTYGLNWDSEILCCDVRDVTPDHLPDRADLVWASFPCQDLSLAGGGAGLKGERSGTFWPFWDLMKRLAGEGRNPTLIVLENVCGTLTSHGGKDFAAICETLRADGYRFGALVIDAVLFVPQSRPRLFIIAVRTDVDIPTAVVRSEPHGEFHTRTLKTAYQQLPVSLKKNWIWWLMDVPPARSIKFSALIEDDPISVIWHTPSETQRLLAMMSDVNLKKIREARREGHPIIGTAYKRTRRDRTGRKVQRAEVRFDDIAGCLRTPAGGSSRQVVVIVKDRRVCSRLISSRETARLMGLSDEYILPDNYNEAYHLTGDGVVVPVVKYLANEILEPVLEEAFKVDIAA